jgi:hypothetical protein
MLTPRSSLLRCGRRLVAAVVAVGSGVARAHAGDASFSDGTAEAGLVATHATAGFVQMQYSSGGAIGDFDNDGWQDVFFLSGGSGSKPDRLFLNNGDGTFTDRAAEWGLTAIHKGKSACVGDFDNDGWLDLYVTSAGPVGQNAAPGHHKLYRNVNGTGFVNVAATAGVAFADPTAESAWTATFGDYDLDGDLDLFVGGFAGSPSNTEHRLFRNDGDGTFTDVTASIGLFAGVGPVAALSARFVDIDDDLYPELLIGGDFKATGSYVGSRYFKNDRDGTFTDMTNGSGTGHEENGMGQTILDVDNDQRLDWYVTSIYWPQVNWTGNKLYRNLGAHAFVETSAIANVFDGGYGWGTVGVDVDHDGFEDLAETSGDASPGSPFYAIPARLWINDGDGTFTERATETGFVHSLKGRSLLRVDVDNDGDQDILVFRYAGALTLLRNDLVHDATTAWVRVFLDTAGRAGLAPNGFGAKVYVTAGGVTRMRAIDGGVSFLGTSELSAHVGLGAATTIDEILVRWPDGTTSTRTNVAINQTLTMSPVVACAADLDGDGTVGPTDLGALLGAWGSGGNADLDGNGTVDPSDLGILLGAWGGC